MNLILTTPPTDEPVGLTELKNHLRVTGNSEDGQITSLGIAARQFAEQYQDAAYLTQTWTLWLNAFPVQRYIKLRRQPIQSIVHIKYYDTEDSATEFLNTNYMLDDAAGRVVLKYGKLWPSVTLRPAKAVEVQYKAGYVSLDALLERRGYVIDAIKQITAHLYENREPIVIGPTVTNVPLTALMLLDADRAIFV